MVHILIGAFMMAAFFLVIDYTRRRKLRLSLWKWILTIFGFLYALFVIEMIVSFLAEGNPKAALVMGIILGFIAVVWCVLLWRFVFSRKSR